MQCILFALQQIQCSLGCLGLHLRQTPPLQNTTRFGVRCRHAPIDVPADVALEVVLQAAADQLEGLLLAVLALVVHDEALHRQRLPMVGVLLEHLRA